MSLKIENKPFSESMLLSAKVGKNGDSGGSDFGSMLKHAEVKQSEAASELEKYMKMTPAQRMAAAILKSMGISQAEFDAMPPEQQAAITAQIAAIMKQQMQDQMENQSANKGVASL
jgi:hypothetical protein